MVGKAGKVFLLSTEGPDLAYKPINSDQQLRVYMTRTSKISSTAHGGCPRQGFRANGNRRTLPMPDRAIRGLRNRRCSTGGNGVADA